MPRANHANPVGFYVQGIYERIRAKESLTALSPDPRSKLDGLTDRERAVLESQKYAPV
jgi:hypothetical protein